MKPFPSLSQLSDADVIDTAKRLAAGERQATAALIACLAEVDARRLYLDEGCSSLFAWCTEVLHLSGDAAYGRIEVARVAHRFPVVLEAIASGSVTMTAIALLRPHLTDANHQQLLVNAHHKSKRDVEQLVAALAPKPDVPTSIRKLPGSAPTDVSGVPSPTLVDDVPAAEVPTPASCSPLLSSAGPAPSVAPVLPTRRPAHRSIVAPLAPERYKIQFTVDRATHDRLRRAQDLLRHAIPNGDLAAIFGRALTLLVNELERQKMASTKRPRASSGRATKGRTIPAAVRRAVWRRDDGRCAFVGGEGRCTSTAFLEFHHVVPFAGGGAATEENIQLRCRAHNQYEAWRDFGAVLRERPAHWIAVGG